ncbi:MAG: DUF6383 domain-containing protein [Parabacteroides sp.]|nr:DUF6383 domain-containing protein [Parabacteroides sp.]
MNKKFSTLLAGAALMMGTVSANAQTYGTEWWESSLPDTLGVSTLSKFSEDEVKGAYFIGTAAASSDSVLYLNEMDTLKLVPRPTGFGEASLDSLSRSLWCVSIIAGPEDGSAQRWEFVNRATGTPLDVPMYDEIGTTTAPGYVNVSTDSTKIGGALGGWAFHKSPNAELTSSGAPIYTYCDNDYVVALTGKGDGSTGVYLYKMLASDINESSKTGAVTKFTLKSAQEIILTADQINNKFGLLKNNTGIKLDFAPDVKGEDIVNPFNEKNFIAETPIFLSSSTPGDSSRYVYIKREVSSDEYEYLKIDTAYANTTGAGKFLKFNWTDLSEAKRKSGQSAHDSLNVSDLKAQYMFLFTYMPSVDSLRIYVKQATFQTKSGFEHNNYFGGPTLATDTVHRQNVYVNLQDLVQGQDLQILTVDSLDRTYTYRARAKVDINTHIKFGWPACSSVGQDLENIADGVYVIMNEEGEALGAPIEKNGAEFRWVKMDKKDAQHMPAYQWVVVKSREGSDASAINITNREFETTKANSVQVYKDGTARGFILRGGQLTNTSAVEAESFDFLPVEDEYIKDAHLGYGYYTEGEVSTLQYNFNYMHKFNMTTFIGKSDKAGDSVLYVNDEAHKGIFNLKFGKEKTYGYQPSEEIEERIPGLVGLKRATYVVYMGADTLVANTKDYYSVGDVALADSFYFKENNCIDGKHYYAIIESYNETIKNDAQKVGIADDEFDNGLKVQVLGETRTSGFNIAVDNTPLYRTFNREVLGENEDNSTDYLVFRDWVRGDEYLADEHNEKWLREDIDFAGIWRSDVAGNKIAFRVDTARLNCDEGSRIKPQYLLSVANVVVDAVPCDAHNTSHTDWEGKPADEWTCSHATRGYIYGKYLVSFQDSVDANGGNTDEGALPYVDVLGGYTRVGFEPAIVTGDSLIFLLGKYKEMNPEELNVNEILESYNKTYTKKELEDHIICKLGETMGNEHHRYTWSFRYVEPEIALKSDKEDDNNRFLIESAGDKDIAPEKGAWLKQQNGCLLLTNVENMNSSFDNAKTGGDGALIFNALQKEDVDADMATDNEAIATSEVTVIAQNGAVRIANAEGKKVVITNILGQTIANTVVTSSDATIAAPAGMVVVAVEGEEAVKAIVK